MVVSCFITLPSTTKKNIVTIIYYVPCFVTTHGCVRACGPTVHAGPAPSSTVEPADDVVPRSVVSLRRPGVAAGEREALLVRGDLFAIGLHLRVLGMHVQQGMERPGLHVQRH